MSKNYTPKELSKLENSEDFSRCFTATRDEYFKDIKTKHLDDMIMRHKFRNLFSTDTNFSKVYQFVPQRDGSATLNWTDKLVLCYYQN